MDQKNIMQKSLKLFHAVYCDIVFCSMSWNLSILVLWQLLKFKQLLKQAQPQPEELAGTQ